MPIHRKHTHDREFTIIENSSINDARLSMKALGLLTILLSKPQDWRISTRQFARSRKEGETALRAAMDELIECGYAIRTRRRDENGKLCGTFYDIFETPFSTENKVSPPPDNPHEYPRYCGEKGVKQPHVAEDAENKVSRFSENVAQQRNMGTKYGIKNKEKDHSTPLEGTVPEGYSGAAKPIAEIFDDMRKKGGL